MSGTRRDKGADLDIGRILRILPHRAPFLLIDRVLDLQPRQSARALKCVTYNEPFFAGHFPGAPIFPSVLALEAMAQLMGVLAYTSESTANGDKLFYFLGVERARFRHPIGPGDQAEIFVEVVQRRSNIWKCDGTVSVGDVLCAEARLLAALTDREDPDW